jgi:hypothetical protein
MSSLVNPFVLGSSAPPPDPSTITNLQLWLQADAITGLSDNTQITGTWPDSSGNGRNATSVPGGGGGPKWRSSLGPNSKPAVQFGVGGSGWFSLPNFMTGFTAGHVFVVMKKITKSSFVPAVSGPPIGDWGATTGDLFVFNTDQKIYDGTGSSVRKATVDPGDITTNWFVYEVRTASGAWTNYKSGTQLFTTATNTVSFNSTPFLAHTVTNTSTYDGYLAEIIFYSRVLNSTEIATVKTYLTFKYGLTIA